MAGSAAAEASPMASLAQPPQRVRLLTTPGEEGGRGGKQPAEGKA